MVLYANGLLKKQCLDYSVKGMPLHSVLAIRTNALTANVFRLVSQFQGIFGEDNVFILLDHAHHVHQAHDRHIIVLSAEDVRGMSLPDIDGWGWQCGDYFYYKFASEVSAHYYWLVEPDVYISDQSLLKLQLVISDRADYLAVNHGERDEGWYWAKHLSDCKKPIYGSAFPMTRLSRSAIDFLMKKRIQRAWELGARVNKGNWPNDEGFVSTTLEQAHFVCKNLTSLVDTRFDKFSTTIPLLNTFAHYDGIAHPVLDWEAFCDKYCDRANQAVRAGRTEIFFEKSLEGLSNMQLRALIAHIIKATHL